MAASTKTPASGGVKSAERTLELLEFLADHVGTPQSLSDITRALGLPKSSAFGLIKTLENRGYVHELGGKYSLGQQVFVLGMAYLHHNDLVDHAQPVIQDLNMRSGETVHFAVLDGAEVLYLSIKESSHPFRIVSQIGMRLPAHVTAVGKALLAERPTDEVLALYEGVGFAAFTPSSITSRGALVDELESIRAQGYSFDDEESNLGVQCVAAPVRDATGAAIAAISITSPTVRMDRDRFVKLARQGAEEISRRLGYHRGSKAAPEP